MAEPAPSPNPAEVYEDFRRTVLPYGPGNIHPRFWGWVIGTGTVTGMLAESVPPTRRKPWRMKVLTGVTCSARSWPQ